MRRIGIVLGHRLRDRHRLGNTGSGTDATSTGPVTIDGAQKGAQIQGMSDDSALGMPTPGTRCGWVGDL